MAEQGVLVHVFITSNRTGETAVFLIEREPGMVEFPTLELRPEIADDEPEIVRRIEAETGLSVALNGFLEPPAGASTATAESRFLLARLLQGTPRVTGSHVGWEWRPGASLLSLQFVPKFMADELRSFMND